RSSVVAAMLAHEIVSLRDDMGKAMNVVEERRRERALKKTVNKNKTGSSLGQREGPDLVEGGDARRRRRQLERSLGNRCDAREAPCFLLHVGEAQITEAGYPAFAQMLEPGGNVGRAVRCPRMVGADEPLHRACFRACFHCHRHDTITPSRSQS